jgi:hypothetical protein
VATVDAVSTSRRRVSTAPPPLVALPLTLTNVTAPLFSDASCAKCGAIILHGPHHLLTTTERTGWGWGRCESRESGRAYTKMALPLLFRAKNGRAPPAPSPSLLPPLTTR